MPIVFSSLSVYSSFCIVIHQLPNLVTLFSDIHVSAKRINDFLISSEIEKNDWAIRCSDAEMECCYEIWPDYCLRRNDNYQMECCFYSINIKNGNFYRKQTKSKSFENPVTKKVVGQITENTEPLLTPENALTTDNDNRVHLEISNLNLQIPKGSLIAVIGKNGSGKTTFLEALLGELYAHTIQDPETNTPINQKLIIDGSICYITQMPWIETKTVKENILFNKSYNAETYNEAIYYSGLDQDILDLEDGDETILYNNGENLSGGQKIRLSLARGLYADKDIYL